MKTILFSFLVLTLLLSGHAEAQTRIDRRFLHRVEFTPNWDRYPMPLSIVETLISQFPYAGLDNIPENCKSIDDSNQTILGANSPVTGMASTPQPNSAFIVWYTNCLEKYISTEHLFYAEKAPGNTDAEKFAAYAGEKTAALCGGTGSCKWSDVPEAKRIEAIVEQLERFVGPSEVIADMGLANSAGDFAVKIHSQFETLKTKNPKAFNFLDVHDLNFMTVAEALKCIRFTILLNDTLKY